jgi:imidazoleglycerol phosphate dehydratase HisB
MYVCQLNLDGVRQIDGSIPGLPFLDHMLELFAKHGLFDLDVRCKGDLEIDDHHSVEDIAYHNRQGVESGARTTRRESIATARRLYRWTKRCAVV